MNEENIPVITDREKLYDKCENIEQLFDKYYLPLLDKHYSKIYELQQENQQLKDDWNELKNIIEKDIKRWEDEEKKWIEHGFMKFGGEANNKIIFKKVLNKMQELEKGKDE